MAAAVGRAASACAAPSSASADPSTVRAASISSLVGGAELRQPSHARQRSRGSRAVPASVRPSVSHRRSSVRVGAGGGEALGERDGRLLGRVPVEAVAARGCHLPDRRAGGVGRDAQRDQPPEGVVHDAGHDGGVGLAGEVARHQPEVRLGVEVAGLGAVEQACPQHRPHQVVLDVREVRRHGGRGPLVEADPRRTTRRARWAPRPRRPTRPGSTGSVAHVDQPLATRPHPVVVRGDGEAVGPDPVAQEHGHVAVRSTETVSNPAVRSQTSAQPRTSRSEVSSRAARKSARVAFAEPVPGEVLVEPGQERLVAEPGRPAGAAPSCPWRRRSSRSWPARRRRRAPARRAGRPGGWSGARRRRTPAGLRPISWRA